MKHPQLPTAVALPRRSVLGLAAALLGAALAPARAATRRPVVVLTAYPEEVTSRFEAAFEKTHPEYRLQFVWRMPHDALPYLMAPDQHGVSVYWSASPRTFQALKAAGALQALQVDHQALPRQIGGTAISDPDDRFVAVETAAYGFALQTQRLAALGLPTPTDWAALAEPRWDGQIALPIPSRVGYAPVMVDIVLQAYGWDRGWALWSAIAANAALVDAGGTFVTDEVATGRRALGLTIDFFAASAIASGAPLRFAYPRHSGVNPAHIAMLSQAPERAGAQAFIDFMLGDTAQAMLAHPSIRKLPVRPSAYAHLPSGYYNPFDAAAQGGLDYDNAQGQARNALVTALFEQHLVADHADLAATWRALRAAEAAHHPRAAAARARLEAPPITEAASADPGLRQRFKRLEGNTDTSTTALETGWRAAAAQTRREVKEMLS